MYFIVRDHHLKYSSKSQKDLDIRRQESVSQAENSKRNAKEPKWEIKGTWGLLSTPWLSGWVPLVEVSFPFQVGSRPGRLTTL